MNNPKGWLFLVDGPSGSGKGSLIKLLTQALTEYGLTTKVIEEEEADKEGREIIRKVRDRARAEGRIGDRETATLLIEHRARIFEELVEPALQNFNIVLLDRGEPATLAYQTINRELTMEEIYQRHRDSSIRLPDLIIILNCTLETAVARLETDKETIRGEREPGPGLSGKFTGEMENRRQIHKQYYEVGEFLEDKTRVLSIETTLLPVEKETEIILSEILDLIGYGNPGK